MEINNDDRARNHQRFRTKRGLHNPHVHHCCVVDYLSEWKGLRRNRKGWHPAGCRGRSLGLAAVFHAGNSASKRQEPPCSHELWGSSQRPCQQVHVVFPQGSHGARRAGLRQCVNSDACERACRIGSRGSLKLEGHDFRSHRRPVSDVSRNRRNISVGRDLDYEVDNLCQPRFSRLAVGDWVHHWSVRVTSSSRGYTPRPSSGPRWCLTSSDSWCSHDGR